MSRSVTRRAHAKINLALGVGPPNADGMHPIATWMHAVDFADRLTLTRLEDAEDSSYRVCRADDAPSAGAVDWPLEEDLAVRAHRLLEERAGRPLPVRLELVKSVPARAGLGGGSSDAAACLLGLNGLFDLGLSLEELARLARRLGADVPFFVDEGAAPRPAIVTGIGERIERLRRRRASILLLLPGFGCATGAVYAAYDRLGPRPLDEHRVRTLARGPVDPARLFNDLAAPAEAVSPELGGVRRAAEALAGDRVLVTGSGSAMFLVLPRGRADEVARRLSDGLAGVTVVRTRLV